MNILITGGAGFIGSSLAEKLIANGNNYVVVADNLSTGSKRKIPDAPNCNLHFVRCDVNDYRDISEVMLSTRFDYVFHYAATVGVKRTQENPARVLNDLEGIKHICNLSKNSRVKRLFFASSSEVYGEPVTLPQHEETTPLNSRLPYAVVKNIGEAFLRSYKKEFGLDYTIFRFFNTYGPKQSIDFVMSKFIRLALRNEDITIFGDGTQTRTFCYIDDNVDACLNALYKNLALNEVVNIGSDFGISILNLAEMIVDISGSSSKIFHVPPLCEGDMYRRLPETTKMQRLLNRPMKPIAEGLISVLNNLEFIMNGHDTEFLTRYEAIPLLHHGK